MKGWFNWQIGCKTMKKKYQDILTDSASLVGKIPGVAWTGVTATAAAYVSAYKDYHKACQLLGVIAVNIKVVDDLETVINKYKNEEGYDIGELKGQVEWYSEGIEKAYKELKEYIAEREKENWR